MDEEQVKTGTPETLSGLTLELDVCFFVSLLLMTQSSLLLCLLSTSYLNRFVCLL